MTLDWAQVQSVAAIGQLRKPMLVVDEFLGGCGAFLIACSGLPAQGVSAASVSTTRLDDVVQVARVFGELRSPDVTAEKFAQRCDDGLSDDVPAPAGSAVQGGSSAADRHWPVCGAVPASEFPGRRCRERRPGAEVSRRHGAVRRFR